MSHRCKELLGHLSAFKDLLLQRLKTIGNYIKTKPIDVVVYMDRFDMFRTDGNDQQVSTLLTAFEQPFQQALLILK